MTMATPDPASGASTCPAAWLGREGEPGRDAARWRDGARAAADDATAVYVSLKQDLEDSLAHLQDFQTGKDRKPLVRFGSGRRNVRMRACSIFTDFVENLVTTKPVLFETVRNLWDRGQDK